MSRTVPMRRRAQPTVDRACLDAVVQRAAEVLLVSLQGPHETPAVGPSELGLGQLGRSRNHARCRPGSSACSPVPLSFRPRRPEWFQEPVALAVALPGDYDERLGSEVSDQVQDVAGIQAGAGGNCLGGLQAEPASENGEPPEQGAFRSLSRS